MVNTVTKESLAARIADLEYGPRSLKEDYTLAAYKMLLATMEAEPVGYFGRFDPDDEDLIDQCSKNVKGAFPLYRHAQPAPAAEDETKDEWRRLALQFDGHRMQAICFLKQILKELPASEFSSAREFLKAGPLPGEEVLRNRIAEIAALSQPAPVVQELDEREAFEAFVEGRFGDTVDRRRAKNGDQGYMAWDMAMAWVVWEARAQK